MEKTAKYSSWLLFFVSTITYCQIPSFMTSLEEVNSNYGNNKVYASYAKEIISNDDRSTFSTQSVGIDGSKLNVMFFSEVNDKFDFYINGQLIKTLIINTSVDTDSDIVNILSYLFDYPRNESRAILRVESSKYGGFETEIRKEYPMLYIKNYKGQWYLDHNTVYKYPLTYFLTNEDQ